MHLLLSFVSAASAQQGLQVLDLAVVAVAVAAAAAESKRFAQQQPASMGCMVVYTRHTSGPLQRMFRWQRLKQQQ
jgi:hypothetical protein